MGIFARRPIVFRLWLRLSLVVLLFSGLALAAFMWMAIEDDIDRAHDDAQARSNAVLTAAIRIGSTGGTPSDGELAIARGLGVQLIQLIGPDGEVALSFGQLTNAGVVTPLDKDGMIANIQRARGMSSEVRITDNGIEKTHLNPITVLSGGHFGTEHVYPLGELVPGGRGAVRLVASYPGLAGDSRTLLYRSLALTAFILFAMVIGLWILLKRLVANPLRDYSVTAMRIAAGQQIRLPAHDRDELGQLGRAINGMADALRYHATVDPLTGLYNLRHLSSSLETMLDEARAAGAPLGLIVCDLDNLKPVNDSYGHATGDLVLKSTAAAMRRWSDGRFTCWRLGGDEFAIALPLSDESRVSEEAASLEHEIENVSVDVADGSVRIGVSVGWALFPEDDENVGALLGIADSRMYQAKARKAGRAHLPEPTAA